MKTLIAGLKRHTLVVWYVARDPKTPWNARMIALFVAGYAFSPIDLIPDFIPIIGLLDDLILIPIGLALVIRLLPADVLRYATLRAELRSDRPVSHMTASVIVLVWFALLWFGGNWVYRNWIG